LKGKKAAGDFFNQWLIGFPDLKLKKLNQLATEDSIAVEIEFSGTNKGTLQVGPEIPGIPATGKRVSNYGSYFAKVKNGKFVEVHTYLDIAGTLMQLGLLSPEAVLGE